MIGRNLVRLVLVAGAIAATSSVVSLAVHAATTQATITACVATGTGDLTMRYSSSGSCGGGQQPITWNEAGPQGPAGAQGPAGPPGPAGKDAVPAVQVVISANSAVNKNPVHSATVTCQGNSRFLYGGWGLIGSTNPIMGRVVLTENRPQIGDRGAPVGWRVKASRHRSEYGETLLRLARAGRAAVMATWVVHNFQHAVTHSAAGGSVDLLAFYPGHWPIARDRYEAAIAEAKKAANLNPETPWGVNAWAVCATS